MLLGLSCTRHIWLYGQEIDARTLRGYFLSAALRGVASTITGNGPPGYPFRYRPPDDDSSLQIQHVQRRSRSARDLRRSSPRNIFLPFQPTIVLISASVDSPRISSQSYALGFTGSGGLLGRGVESVFALGRPRSSTFPLVPTDLYHQRQSVHRPLWRSERTDRTRAHIRPALPTTHPLAPHRPHLSPSTEIESQGIGVYATVLERVRSAERGKLYSYALAECGDGDVVMGGRLF